MNNLIAVDFDTQMVSARELHESLKIKSNFTTWFKRMCEYGFTEGIDFNPLTNEQVQKEGIDFFPKMEKTSETGGRPQTDYNISVDMAKQICMIQRTPEGKAVRQYLIDLEKTWNTPEQVMARALRMADMTINKLKEHNTQLLEDNQMMKPKAVFADAVSTSDTCILIGELAKIIKQNGIDIGQNRLFTWMRNKGYLISRKGTDYNMPTQRAIEMKLFKIKETVIAHSDGSTRISKTVKVTGKGQQYFINKFLCTQECRQSAEA